MEEANSISNTDLQPTLLSCPICSNPYENPKILSCWHSFCLKCLKDYAPENSITLVCPLCFIPSVLPKLGLDHLPDNCLLASLEKENSNCTDLSTIKTLSNFLNTTPISTFNDSSPNLSNKNDLLISTTTLTNYEPSLNQTQMSEITFEDGNVSSSDERELGYIGGNQMDTASSSAIVMDDSVLTDTSQSGVFSQSFRSSSDFSTDKLYCRIHERRSIELYCNQCNTVLCKDCGKLEHYGHDQSRLVEAIEKYRVILQSVESTIKQNYQFLLSNKQLIEKTKQNLYENYNHAKQKCIESFGTLQKTLQDRMAHCLNQLNSLYVERSEALNEQIAKISESIAATKSQQDFSEKVLDSERSELILLATKAFNCEMDNKNEILKNLKFKIKYPIESSFIEFDNNGVSELENSCKHVNGIVSEKLLCSNMINLSKLDLGTNCIVNNLKKISVIFTASEHEDILLQAYKQNADRIVYAEMIAPNQEKVPVEVVQVDNTISNKNAVCYLKFTPQHSGLYHLEVLNYGIPIRGSPFEIKVVQPFLENFFPIQTRQSYSQRKSFPFQNFINKSNLPVKIGTSAIKSTNVNVKTPPTSSKLHRSNSSLNRPPWNSSPNRAEQLRRTASTGIVKSTPPNVKLSNTSLQNLRSRTKPQFEKQTTKFISPRENRILVDKIVEEENYQIQGLSNVYLDSKTNHLQSSKSPRNVKYNTPTTTIKRRLSNNLSSTIHGHQQLLRSKTTAGILTPNKLPLKNIKDSNQSSNLIQNDDFKCFGTKGVQTGEFLNVQGVCYKDGCILVTDSKNQCIQFLELKTGMFLKKINLTSLSLKAHSFPVGISVDSSGKIYVADYENHCILIFNENGQFGKKIGYNHLLGPKGVTVDSQENLLVVDNRGCCVQTFSSNSGEFAFRFGIQGYRDEELSRPHFCALSLDENLIIISDFRGDKVKMFTRDGKFVKCFGSDGLRGPTGIAVDRKTGNIVVCNFVHSKIQVYRSNGFYMYTIDTSISPLSGPQGVCFIDDDHILVADSGNHCLKIFKYKQ